ncbi:NAD(P)/FAD-dependent oxidoreductase [Streptomyces sp. RKAG293]|uniref:flavin monoamine oxidase family protein n=1 Tax=Streptomyces sp. RKAG293 TaxID=2893403 RepID=UPI002033A69F|nr:NAD(P)/FAD-dependent oxidoreductase [Streptomyces sp. RKAG293]MCM2422814.1 FAD-dependent oxidoreductase [Streptomyces sp. RKAG293]
MRSTNDIGRRRLLGSALAMAATGTMASCTSSTPPRGGNPTVPEPLAYLRTSWSIDPFALCSYSYLAPSSLGARARAMLAAPVADRLYFAGEATSSEAPSTAHGALESGRRAAAQVISAAEEGEHIVIIGSGFAGIGCARALVDQDYQVTVLEGRDRIGGRIWTQHIAGVPAEMGASWIHGSSGNAMTAILKETGDPSYAFDYDNSTGEDEQAMRELAAYEKKLGDVDDPNEATVASVMPRDPSAALRTALNINYPLEYAAEPSQLSVEATLGGRDLKGPDLLLPRGYDRMLAHLRGDIPVRVRQVVARIQYGADGVTVTLRDGSTVRADRAVITVPIGVLKAAAIGFEPALPDAKQEAVKALGAGLLDKLWLEFPEPFWDKDVDVIEWSDPGNPSLWSWWVNGYRAFGKPVLLGFNGGDQAHRLAKASDGEVVDSAMRALRHMYS